MPWTFGIVLTVIPPAATVAEVRRSSKSLSTWRRQPDGAWRFEADGGNARPDR